MARFDSTTTPLASAGTWTSGGIQSGLADRIQGTVFADQAGTIYIEQSFNNVNWDVSTSYTISASAGVGFSEEIVAPYLRVRYVNGAAAQTAFRLYARLTSAGSR